MELRLKVSCHQFHPSWQQRILWRDGIQPYKLGTQNIAQLLLSLSLAFNLCSMKEQWLQIQILDSLVNIANDRHVSPSHHLSVTLRMFAGFDTAWAKDSVYRTEMLMRKMAGWGRGRGV